MNSGFQVHPRVIQVIQKQVTEMIKHPPDSVQYILNEIDILDIQADIHGPVGTPYSGGVFRCKLVIPTEFPKIPPKGYFLTKIFHPNISDKGEICVNTLKKDWDPTSWSLQNIFEVIRCLLIVPFPESALNEEAGKEFMEDYDEYFKHARLITDLYAIPKEKPTAQGTDGSPIKKPDAMEISFENSQDDSPKKLFPAPVTSVTFNPDNQLFKGGMNEPTFTSSFKVERPEEVLMTVTNSYTSNPIPLSPLDEIALKKSSSLQMGMMPGIGGGMPAAPVNGNGSLSAKKENDDKKKWRKRI